MSPGMKPLLAASPSEGQSQRLTVTVPAGLLHRMNSGSFSSRVLTTIFLHHLENEKSTGNQRLVWKGLALMHSGECSQVLSCLSWIGDLSKGCVSLAAMSKILSSLLVSPDPASSETLSSEHRNVYMEGDCQGFKLHLLRNKLSSYSLFVSFLQRLKCFLI